MHHNPTRAAIAAIMLLLLVFSGEQSLNSDSFCAYYLGITAALVGYLRSRSRLDFLGPIPGLLLLTFLYAIAAGRFVEQYGLTDHGFPVDARLLSQYYHVCLTGMTGLAFGFLAAPIEPQQTEITPEQPVDLGFRRQLFRAAVIVGLLSLPWSSRNFNFLSARSYAEQALASRVEYQAASESGLVEVLLSASPTLVVLWAATVLLLRPSRSRQGLYRMLGLLLIGAYVATYLRSGARYYIAAASLIPMVFWHYRRRAFSWRQVLIGGTITYLVANTIPVVRHLKEPGEMLQFYSQELDRNGLKYLRPELSGELLTSTNLMRQIAGLENHETELLYFDALGSELLGFVPRYFYPNRPLPTSERFLVQFYPGIREKGGGFGLFYFQEGYWAGGEIGVLISMFVYGYLAQWTFARFRHYLNQDAGALVYSGIYLSLVTSAVRTGIVLSYKAALMNFIPLLMILAVDRLRLNRDQSRVEPTAIPIESETAMEPIS